MQMHRNLWSAIPRVVLNRMLACMLVHSGGTPPAIANHVMHTMQDKVSVQVVSPAFTVLTSLPGRLVFVGSWPLTPKHPGARRQVTSAAAARNPLTRC